MATPVALWHAGLGICSCCAKPMPAIGMEATRNARPSVEHVFPKSPGKGAGKKIQAFHDLFPGMFKNRRTAIAHSKCNSRKGNRAPTGCEVVFLMAVNARIERDMTARQRAEVVEVPSHWGSTSAERTLARKMRRKAAKARQALTDPIEALRALPGALLVVTRDG